MNNLKRKAGAELDAATSKRLAAAEKVVTDMAETIDAKDLATMCCAFASVVNNVGDINLASYTELPEEDMPFDTEAFKKTMALFARLPRNLKKDPFPFLSQLGGGGVETAAATNTETEVAPASFDDLFCLLTCNF